MKHETTQVAGGSATCRCGDAAADVAPGRGFQPTSGAGEMSMSMSGDCSMSTMTEDYEGWFM